MTPLSKTLPPRSIRFALLLLIGMSHLISPATAATTSTAKTVTKTPSNYYAAGFTEEQLVDYKVPAKNAVTESEIREAISRLEKADYSWVEERLSKLRNDKESMPIGHSQLLVLYRGMADTELKPHDTLAWRARFQLLQKWRTARPQSQEAQIALAFHWIAYAWDARGDQETATREGLKCFRERLESAFNCLSQTAPGDAGCPGYYVAMLTIARGRAMRHEATAQLFEAARAKFPWCVDMHIAYATYLLPRWHGLSPNEWAEFAERESDKLGGEEGDILYARIISFMHMHGELPKLHGKDANIRWPRLKSGLAAIIRKNPESMTAKNFLCRFSYLAKAPYEETEQYFNAIGPNYIQGAWLTKKNFLHARHIVMSRKETIPESAFAKPTK